MVLSTTTGPWSGASSQEFVKVENHWPGLLHICAVYRDHLLVILFVVNRHYYYYYAMDG